MEARRHEREPVFSRRLLIGWIAAAVVVFAISLYLMGSGEVGGSRQHRPQHVLALGHRPRRHRRGAAAAGAAGRQEPIQFAGEALARKRPGHRRAAPEPPIGGGDPHAAQGRHRPAGAAEVDRGAERANAGMASRGPRALHRRRAMGAAAGCAARRGGARERRGEVDDECARSRPQPGFADPAHARAGPAGDHRRRPRHAGRRDQRPRSQDLGSVGPRRHLQSRPGARGQCRAGRRHHQAPARPASGEGEAHRVRRNRARLCRQAAEPVPAAVPLPVRGRHRPGADRRRAAVVGDAGALRGAAIGAAAVERRGAAASCTTWRS